MGVPLWACLAGCLVAGPTGGAATPPPAAPAFGLAYWEVMPGPMQLPVFDGMAIELGQQLVVLGGFTRELEATRAIQIRSTLDGWRPIGSTMHEARARASLHAVGGGRVLVLGGYSGTWGKNATARDDGETLDPLVAGSGRDIEPFGEPLDGHGATELPGGRIAVSCGCSLRVLDLATERWSAPMELARERHHHASVLVGRTLVLIGGDDLGTIESIDLDDLDALPATDDAVVAEAPAATSLLWERGLADAAGAPLSHVAAIAIDGRMAYAAGGFRTDERTTVDRTWTVDVARRAVVPGRPLPLPSGACDLVLTRHPRGVIVLDGEWWRDGLRGNANAALLVTRLPGAADDSSRLDWPEVWRLPGLGSSADLAHRMLAITAHGAIEAVGGYRYRSPTEIPLDGEPAGVIVVGTGERLAVDVAGTAD